MWDSQRHNTVWFSLCAALALSLIVIASLICSIKACDCCNGKRALLIPCSTWEQLTSLDLH